MAQLLGSVFGSFLRSFNDQIPFDSVFVVEVKSEEYTQQPVVDREECIALYGPYRDKYDVVLQIPYGNSSQSTVSSLFRSSNLTESKKYFTLFKDKIPLLLECREEYSSRSKLQVVCSLIKDHSTWNLAHISAYLGLDECLNHPFIQSQINSTCATTGQTPLHIAVLSEKTRVVQIMLDMDAKLDIPDLEGNTVYHLAAKTTKDMIQLLANKSGCMINHRNKDGHTALHVACLADKPDCVKALIYAGADVNATGVMTLEAETPTTGSAREIMEMYPRQINSKEMKHGGTPLHWAMSREVVEALVDLGCTVDARDFKGDTALHTLVLRSRLQCVITLLSYGADVNSLNENLDTPLHLAVKVICTFLFFILANNVVLVKSLIVFGADVNLVNKFGDTPRHVLSTSKSSHLKEILHILHSVGARRCEYGKPNCSEGCIHEGKMDGHAPEVKVTYRSRHMFDDMLAAATVAASLARKRRVGDEIDFVKRAPEGYRILCLDGGGIRGLLLIQVLIALEDTLDRPLVECFDWITGTSTGGILALLIAAGRTAKYCQNVYFRLKNKVFVGIRPYDSEPLERFLQKELGENTTMSDVKTPKVAITGTLADRHPAELHFFRNYQSPMSLMGMEAGTPFPPTLSPEEQIMWRAARASGAAPTYFRAMGRFVDGGLISNNPTLDIMTEVHEYNCALKATGQEAKVRPIGCVVSVGTGKPPITPVNAIDVFCPQSVWDAAKMAFGMSALGNLLIDQATASDGRVVDRARAWCNMIDVPYFRFNPDISEDVALDETKDEVLVHMLWETMVYMRSRKKDLSNLKDLLLLP